VVDYFKSTFTEPTNLESSLDGEPGFENLESSERKFQELLPKKVQSTDYMVLVGMEGLRLLKRLPSVSLKRCHHSRESGKDIRTLETDSELLGKVERKNIISGIIHTVILRCIITTVFTKALCILKQVRYINQLFPVGQNNGRYYQENN